MFARRVHIHGAAERSVNAMQVTLGQVAGDVQDLKAAASPPQLPDPAPPAAPENPPPAEATQPTEPRESAPEPGPRPAAAQLSQSPAPPPQWVSGPTDAQPPPAPPEGTRARVEAPGVARLAEERHPAPAAAFVPLWHRLAGAWQQLTRPPLSAPAEAASTVRSAHQTPVPARLPQPPSLSPEIERLLHEMLLQQTTSLRAMRSLLQTVLRHEAQFRDLELQLRQLEARALQ